MINRRASDSFCSVVRERGHRLLRIVVCAALLMGVSQPAHATIARWLGWKYSDNKTYKRVEYWVDTAGTIVGAVELLGLRPPVTGATIKTIVTVARVIDPVPGSIVSGRVTFAFDPAEIVTAAGWYREFGVNPDLPAPPIGSDPDLTLLQTAANPAMVGSGIFIDQANGRAVFEYNWGADGFVPMKNMDAEGHFNILGLYLAQPNDLLASTSEIVGSLDDVLANGTNASTYMSCNSPDGGSQGTCGDGVVPEPSTRALLTAALFAFGVTIRRRHLANLT